MVAYAKGASRKGSRVHVPAHVNVKAIRTKLGMTQQTFAARFGFSINTLRHWEQGMRAPEGPTRAYLLVIDRAPRAVEKALRIADLLLFRQFRVRDINVGHRRRTASSATARCASAASRGAWSRSIG